MSLKSLANWFWIKRDPTNEKYSSWALIFYVLLVLLLTAKVLWGYWERDLTFGDTSSYFGDATRWYQKGQVNIVWSPLYTAYFGSWLGVTKDASIATFLHRVGLILVSTGLVSWLAYITLPRLLAIFLVAWWVVLPIHYDTLYEVHLFGALPILAMALVALLVGERWRGPALLGIALVSTVLIRNEYVLAVAVLAAWPALHWLRQGRPFFSTSFFSTGIRFGAIFFAAGILIAGFYSASYIKGDNIRERSKPKHTLNMCQVFAFGYQQRHYDWVGSPWTDCTSLMQEKFGMPLPSLREMIAKNPTEVIEHFAWNLSLTRAGMEVLLFNATSASDNPDYAPVSVIPVIPSVLLILTLIVASGGAIVVLRNPSSVPPQLRANVSQMLPVILAAIVMAVAVVLTQRPRPSYFLGIGVLYMWFVAMMLSVFLTKEARFTRAWGAALVGGALVILVPSYKSLPLPSKSGTLGEMYKELSSHAPRLCQSSGVLAIGEYANNLDVYLCATYRLNSRGKHSGTLALSSMSTEKFSTPENFVSALGEAGIHALVIDPFLIQKNPGLMSCPDLRDALLKKGWEQLAYSLRENRRCISAYVK